MGVGWGLRVGVEVLDDERTCTLAVVKDLGRCLTLPAAAPCRLIVVGQLKKAPPRLLNNPGYQEQKEQARKHRRILDVLSLSFALALMIIQWGGPLMTLAFRAVVIWGVPSKLYELWQKFNVSRGVLFACAIALIIIEFGLAFLP